MSIRTAALKEVVQSTVDLIESAHCKLKSGTRHVEAAPLPLSSATLTLIPLMLTEIRFDRAARLHVFTHAHLTDFITAALAHAAKMPVDQLGRGEIHHEREFLILTSVCGKLASSPMRLVHAAEAADLLSLLTAVPADAFILTDLPLSAAEMEQMRELADARRLTVIHYSTQSVMPAYRFW